MFSYRSIALIAAFAIAPFAAAQEKTNNTSAPNFQPPSDALAPDANGAIHLPTITVPFSLYASPEAKKVQTRPGYWLSNRQ